MTARRTLERILRDEDDASAQTVRSWCLVRDGDGLKISPYPDVPGILIRVADVAQLVADLQEIAGRGE